MDIIDKYMSKLSDDYLLKCYEDLEYYHDHPLGFSFSDNLKKLSDWHESEFDPSGAFEPLSVSRELVYREMSKRFYNNKK